MPKTGAKLHEAVQIDAKHKTHNQMDFNDL